MSLNKKLFRLADDVVKLQEIVDDGVENSNGRLKEAYMCLGILVKIVNEIRMECMNIQSIEDKKIFYNLKVRCTEEEFVQIKSYIPAFAYHESYEITEGETCGII